MSTTDTANILEITEENVKVRLHRARALLREGLYTRAGIERKCPGLGNLDTEVGN